MNIRPHHHLESTWLNQDLPGAGTLDEHELDDACSRKRVILLTPDQCAAVDETAGLCGVCSGECASPQACERPLQEAHLSRFFFLAPYLARYPWLGPVLITCVVIVWMCLDAYLEAT